MKAILNLRKSVFYVAALAAMFTVASCDDDDPDPAPTVLNVNDVNGTYEGKLVTPARDTEASVIKAEVTSGKLTVSNFPIADFVLAVEGEDKAEEVAAIVTAIGDTKYEVNFKSSLNAAKDSIFMTLDNTPLIFSYEVDGASEGDAKVKKEIEVTLKANENGSSYSLKKVLKVNISAEELKVGGEALEGYEAKNLQFELNKKN